MAQVVVNHRHVDGGLVSSQRLVGIARFGDHSHVRLIIDHRARAHPDGWMIVHQQHSNGVAQRTVWRCSCSVCELSGHRGSS
jgi:hypothetical protein